MHKNRKIELNSKKNLIIYTDGSLIELEREKTKSTGASIYREIDNLSIFELSISLGSNIEVYDAELYALRAGLREAFKYITYNPIIDNIYLFSDNQAAIKRL